jgi:DNA polymerase
MTDKTEEYHWLVEQRKECTACVSLGMTNPSVCADGVYDSDHIGPWSQWHGSLDADLMIIGQDWGGREYYIDQQGVETDDNDTNRNLQTLLASIGYDIALPCQPRKRVKLFFTNAVLCLKPGRLTGSVKAACFKNCGIAFLRPQIDLIQPKAVVTLGLQAYKAVMRAYGRRPRQSMRDAIQTTEVLGSSTLVPVYHCGYYGTLSRPLEGQKQDWQRVKPLLQSQAPPNTRTFRADAQAATPDAF